MFVLWRWSLLGRVEFKRRCWACIGVQDGFFWISAVEHGFGDGVQGALGSFGDIGVFVGSLGADLAFSVGDVVLQRMSIFDALSGCLASVGLRTSTSLES